MLYTSITGGPNYDNSRPIGTHKAPRICVPKSPLIILKHESHLRQGEAKYQAGTQRSRLMPCPEGSPCLKTQNHLQTLLCESNSEDNKEKGIIDWDLRSLPLKAFALGSKDELCVCKAEDKDSVSQLSSSSASFLVLIPSLEEQPQLVLSGPDRHLLTPGTRAPPVAHKNIATGIPASIPAAEKLRALQSSQVTPPTDTGRGTGGPFFPRPPSRPHASPHSCLSRLPEHRSNSQKRRKGD